MKRILIIQTAYLGDVILATSVLEKLHQKYPDAELEILLRNGNESVFKDHPYVSKVWRWDKENKKYKNLLSLIKRIRKKRFDAVFNLHRFATSGMITAMSAAPIRAGFDKNPFSFSYTHKVKHIINTAPGNKGLHETERNQLIIAPWTDEKVSMPKLYPSETDESTVVQLKSKPYVCIAPASVWATKEFPAEKWCELINTLAPEIIVYLIGSKADKELCEKIKNESGFLNLSILAGSLSILQTASLMRDAKMNFVNDSAPTHIASSVNAPVTTIYCSTIPEFGFGPLSDISHIVQINRNLECRPCGLHGKKACPEFHFNCAKEISVKRILNFEC